MTARRQVIYVRIGVQYVVRGTGGTDTTATWCITACAGNINSVGCIGQITTRGQVIYTRGFVCDILCCSSAATATAAAAVIT